MNEAPYHFNVFEKFICFLWNLVYVPSKQKMKKGYFWDFIPFQFWLTLQVLVTKLPTVDDECDRGSNWDDLTQEQEK